MSVLCQHDADCRRLAGAFVDGDDETFGGIGANGRYLILRPLRLAWKGRLALQLSASMQLADFEEET